MAVVAGGDRLKTGCFIGHSRMDTKLLRLILLKRDSSDRIDRAAHELTEFLHSHPDTELLTVAVIEDLDPATLDGSEVAVVLGGDGAIIRACRQLGKHQLPIIGINLGRLGFLADLSLDMFRERFDEIRTRKFDVVEHLMFKCTMTRPNGESTSWLGVNEVAVSAEATLQMVEVALSIDGAPVTTYSCDGLIISTPVGSTAHSLSAGGPAIRQDLPVFVVTPICPHTLSNRALVDDANRRYQLELPSARTEVVLVIDGQIRVPFQVGDRVDFEKADVTFKLARLAGHNYYSVLEKKLGWSGQPRYSADD
jgi:NAD+ kinase